MMMVTTVPLSDVTEVDVIVIGAGISGLAAASALIDGGIADVVVLEAQEYAGGRIKSLRHKDHVIELGAQWIHGTQQNALYDFALEAGLVDSRVTREAEGIFVNEDGERIDPDLVEEVREIVLQSEDECMATGGFSSVGEFMHDYFNSRSKRRDQSPLDAEAMFRWMMKFEAIDNACECMSHLSTSHWGDYEECGGEAYVTVKNGYSNLVKELAAKIPEDKIIFGKPVSTIFWEKSTLRSNTGSPISCRGNIIVKTEDNQYLACRNVIVTCSLGFLKAFQHEFFHPYLPEPQKKAIESVGFGVIDKIFLEFPDRFWDEDCLGIQLVWKNEDESVLTSQEKVDGMSDRWYKAVTGFDIVMDQPHMLMGWIYGDEARYMETLDDGTVGDVLTRILRRFLRKPSIPPPSVVIRTSWQSNKFIRGSYSFRGVQTALDVVPHLTQAVCAAQSEEPLILFAGEACSLKRHSTVHGAFESGRHQAIKLLQYYTVK